MKRDKYTGLRVAKRKPGKPVLSLIVTDEEAATPPGEDKGAWAEMVLPGGWFARGRMVVQGDRVVVSELRLVSATDTTPRGGVNQEVVRRIPLGTFGPFALSTADFADKLPPAFNFAAKPITATLQGIEGLLPPRPRPRRSAGQDDRFYAELARDYLARIEDGSRSPVKDLAIARREKATRVRDQVHEARERGLLSESKSGRRGGMLLPRAKELLGLTNETHRASTRKK